jgi:hypothetical protein
MVAPPERSLPDDRREAPGLSPRDAALKAEILRDPESGEASYLSLQARLIEIFGPAAGVMLRQCIYWTGKGKHGDGRFHKSRDEWQAELGLGHRDQEAGRRILTGQKQRNGQTFGVLEEYRSSRRAAMRFRVDLEALAAVLGLASDGADHTAGDAMPQPSTVGQDSPPDAERPRGATESPRGASERPRGASEWPRGAASKITSESTPIEDPQRDFVLRTSEPAASRRTLPPLMDDLLEEEEGHAEGMERPVAPALVEALRSWLARHPDDHPDRKPPEDRPMQASWLASTLWAYERVPARPTPAEIEAALIELRRRSHAA